MLLYFRTITEGVNNMNRSEQLIEQAKEAREHAYVPFSKFKVGAAVRTQSGNVYFGCNIENSSFPLTCCAERTAIFKAVSQGEREFTDIAVIADTEDVVSPCGACRQVMAEFFTDEVGIYLSNLNGAVKRTTLEEILPNYFKL